MTRPQYGKPETWPPPRIPHLIPGITVQFGWREFIVASLSEDDERVVLELVSTGKAENELAVRLDQRRTRTREARKENR